MGVMEFTRTKPKKLKAGMGSNKGSSFEREWCKKLSLWVSDGKKDDVFWRTAGSGARATSRKKQGKCTCNSEGDMGCLDPEYSWFLDFFLVEMKRGYPDWRLDHFLQKKPPKGGLIDVWNRLAKDARAAEKSPLLIFKQDRRDVLFFHQESYLIHPPWALVSGSIYISSPFTHYPATDVKRLLHGMEISQQEGTPTG